MKPERAKGILLCLASVLFMHLTDVVIKLSGNSLYLSQELFLRFSSSALLLLPFIFYNKQYRQLKPANAFLLILRAILIYSGTFFWFQGVQRNPINLVTAVSFSIPLMTLLFSYLILSEPLSDVKVIANLIGFFGVLVVIDGGFGSLGPGSVVYLLIAAVSYSLFAVVSKQCANNEDVFSTLFFTSLLAALLAGSITLFQWQELTTMAIGRGALLGLLANLTSFFLLKAYTLAEASYLAPFIYSEMILSLISGYFLFHEEIFMLTLAGTALIMLSNLLLCWKSEP
ncbi:DMT family transporter [Thalassotalea sp. G20_0]|uniref:DMT family transporter n=1 Tax=Thalassotalea sp. G20_0 TaxID=2821093 RepID=UPI001ADB0E81|nr:DMT family transporter [Thalassotalea sp. G20_0]MBO9494087.1 DMT family transporter [Thalassotalea sp. G20_0]